VIGATSTMWRGMGLSASKTSGQYVSSVGENA
jgi:hypothetical protein